MPAMRKNLYDTYPRVFDRSVERSDPNLFSVTTPENVFQEAQKQNRPLFRYMMNDLMQHGSGIAGYENLKEMGRLVDGGKSALILSAHFSNFDVPALYTLLYHRGEEGRRLFEKIIFIAGRKLTEGPREVKAMAEMFNRVVITAKGVNMTPEEIQLALAINKASQKAIAKLQKEGNIFLLYPTGTRSRMGDAQTYNGIREIYNYMRKFDYFMCCGIAGIILPARDDVPMIGEYPRKDRVTYSFGPVRKTEDYLAEIEAQLYDENSDKKQFVIDKVMDQIYALGFDPRKAMPLAQVKYNPYAIYASNAYRNMVENMGQGLKNMRTKVAEQFSSKISQPVVNGTRNFREALKSFFE
ncbi:MAG: hypothetical protein LDLANPLL_00117 [Turneriella sp.]|nr:hypothetical protein [Turneriella sp.]